MAFPRVRAIVSKLGSAKLAGNVLKNSLQFKLRRRALRRFKSTDFNTVIVDMDGTLYEGDANKEGLKVAYGERKGAQHYNLIISKIISGELSVEGAIVEGNNYFVERGFSRYDFEKVYEKIKPRLRTNLIIALKSIKDAGNTLVLATLSSQGFGLLLAKKLEEEFGVTFDAVVGTKLDYSDTGKIVGVESLVGLKDGDFDGIPVKSKLTAVKHALAGKGKEFDLKKTVLITDSYSDIDLAKMLVTILIKPKKSSPDQKVSQRLKLADYIFDDNDNLKDGLESLLLN